jgi:hypothetical protein
MRQSFRNYCQAVQLFGLTSPEAMAEVLFLSQTECVAAQVVPLPIGEVISTGIIRYRI